MTLVRLHAQEGSQLPVPDYMQRTDGEPPEGRVLRLPARGDVDPRISEIREQLIIEFCWPLRPVERSHSTRSTGEGPRQCLRLVASRGDR